MGDTTQKQDRSTSNRHNERLLDLLENGSDSDITLIVGTDKELIMAHKIILKASSPVFQRIFKESSSASEIEILNVEPANFKLFLKFVYAGDSSTIGVEHAVPLLNLADVYQVPDLSNFCGKLLEKELTIESALKIFQQAIEFNQKGLEDSSLQFICKYAYEIIDSSKFLQLSCENLCKILLLDDLATFSENQVLEACIRWATEECSRQRTKFTPKYCRSVMENVLPLIRFPQMKSNEFCEAMIKYDILTTEEIQSISFYQHIERSKWLIGASLPKRLFNPNPRKYHRVPKIERIVKRLDTKSGCISTGNSWHRICSKCEMDTTLLSIGLNDNIILVNSNEYDDYYDYYCCPVCGLHISNQGSSYSYVVTVKLEDEDMVEVLAEKTQTVQSTSNQKIYHLAFDRPVQISAETWYTASLRVESPYHGSRYYSSNNSAVAYTKESDGMDVKVEFKNAECVEDGGITTNIVGQMAEFKFFMY